MAAKTISRTVNINYQVKGIKEIQKEVAKVELFAGETDLIKQIKRESAELVAILSKEEGGLTDPKTAEQFSKRYEKLLKLQEKSRLSAMRGVDEDSAITIEDLNEQIDAKERLIKLNQQLWDRTDAAIQEDKNGKYSTNVGVLQKETINQAAEKVLKPEDTMLSTTGRVLKSPDSFIKKMKEVDEIVGSIGIKNETINKKLATGEKLTQEEVEILNKALEAAKKKGTLSDKFKLNGEEINEQFQIRNRLEEEQSKILYDRKDSTRTKTEDIIDDSTTKLMALEQEKQKTEELNLSKEDLSHTERIALDASESGAETNIKLSAEHKRQLELQKEAQKKATESTKKDTKAKKENTTAMGKAVNQIFNYGLAFTMMRRVYSETLRTIKDLDAALTEMAVVTTMSRKEAWKLVPLFQDIARETGFASTEIAKLSTVYFRQGRSLKDVIELTTVAARAARIAGISAAESADYLTSAVNGFAMAADQALAVSDKFAALAASSASSYDELAKGLSKFAAQANIAGISMDFALGMLAKGVETTREAPETIGTALKTVIARMRELTDLGKTFEDGMNVNRVETALRQVGVQLIDTNGQFRDMEDVLTDIGNSWETLNTNQKASVAVALAGTRQQSRLISIMNDFDRTLELVNIAQYSAGATMAQHAEYMKSMEAATVNLQNAWQKFITTITNSETIIAVIKVLTKAIDGLSWVMDKTGFIGRNLFTIIVLLVGVIKTYSLVTMLAVKMGLLDIAVKEKGVKATFGAIFGNKLYNKSILKVTATLKKFIVAMTTTYWYITAIVAVIAIAVIAYNIISKAQERRIAKLKEERQELQKLVYETNKAVTDINKLADAIEEINNKPIKLEADYDALEGLVQEMEQLETDKDISILVERYSGEIDYDASLANLRDYQEEQKDIMLEALEDITINMAEAFALDDATSKELAESYSDSMVVTYEDTNEKLSDEQRAFFDNYLLAQIKQDEDLIKQSSNNTEKLQAIYDEYYANSLNSLEDFNEAYTSITSGETISEQISAFQKIMNSNDYDKVFKEGLANYFPNLELFANSYDKFNDTFNAVLDKIGLSEEDYNEFSKQITDAGLNPQTILNALQSGTDSLMANDDTLSYTEATARAFSVLGTSIDDVKLKNYLFAKSSTESMLGVAQETDRLNSVIANLSDTQDKFMSGDLSQADMFKFIEDNMELFEQEGMIERFLAGDDISGSVIKQLAEQYDYYENSLISINIQLAELEGKTDTASEATRKNLLTLKSQVLLSMQYDGVLKGLTYSQYEYNSALKSYNRISELGIEDIGIRERMLNALKKVTEETILETSQNIANLKDTLTERLGEDALNKYIIFVDGIATINTDMYQDLEYEQRKYVDDFINNMNTQEDAMFDAFKSYRDAEVEAAQKAADEKTEIYEDYFAALDRLQEKEETKNTREDLMTQIQRLQGATDATSRQKAKELQQELIELDKQAQEDSQAQSREDLLNSVADSVTLIEEQFAKSWTDFVNAGSLSGQALVNSLKENGLLDDTGAIRFGDIIENNSDTETNTQEDEELKKEFLDSLRIKEGRYEGMLPWQAAKADASLRANGGLSGNQFGVNEESIYDDWSQQQKNWVNQRLSLAGITQGVEWAGENARAELGKVVTDWNFLYPTDPIMQYKKGGMVDYSGIAQMHGTKSSPEAVLSAEQTQMFIGLRDALSGLKIDGRTSAVTVENITIQTQSLNNNQDFNRAGKTLAEAFSSAIGKRGISVNAKR